MHEPDVEACLRVLAKLIAEPERCDDSPLLARVREQAARLVKVSRKQARSEGRERDRDILDRAGIRTGTDSGTTLLAQGRPCYVCGQTFQEVHGFYDSLCPACAEVNLRKRGEMVDLSGRVALLTGGRVKIGHAVALRLLRAGAAVQVTTRFPHDAARRFAQEADFAVWADRLTLHGLDLRALPAVERFADELANRLDRLDIIINNAAQTVRRPAAYYRALVDLETPAGLPDGAMKMIAPSLSAAALTQVPLLAEDREANLALFPAGEDRFGRPVDLREKTSWTLDLPEVELGELVEVHAINCLAPFVLLRRLDGLLVRTTGPRFVVNVSAGEGHFTAAKTGKHPHTNMAKAALNMLTRTSADSYAARGIYINSVDPGWVSNEAPVERAATMERAGFREPLDLTDAAARVVDPIFSAVRTGSPAFGVLFKDYRAVPW